MSIILNAEKQPWERKDYDAFFDDWLPTGDTIATATVSVIERAAPLATPTLVADLTETFQKQVKVWLSAGTAGVKYLITIRAVTAANRKVECEMVISVKEQA